jgi:hypothetical protein
MKRIILLILYLKPIFIQKSENMLVNKKQAQHLLEAFSLFRSTRVRNSQEKVLCKCAWSQWRLALIYSIFKAFLQEEGFAFHQGERIDKLQGGCSKLKGILKYLA